MIIGATLANEYFQQGLYSRGEQQVRKLIARDPQFPNARHQLVDHNLWNTGDPGEALANAEKLSAIDPENLDALMHQIEVHAEIGEFKVAAAIQHKIIELSPDSLLTKQLRYRLLEVFAVNDVCIQLASLAVGGNLGS